VELLDAPSAPPKVGITVRAGAAESDLSPQERRVRGSLVLVLSTADPLEARIEAAAAALHTHGAALLEDRFLPPAVRERLERAAASQARGSS
jgi:hypothetical protein